MVHLPTLLYNIKDIFDDPDELIPCQAVLSHNVIRSAHMEHYDRRMVYAPEWMRTFSCLAGDCPEVCCQQWNVDVDPAHAESLRHIEDPELQELMSSVLRSVRIRRPGSRQTETVHRLALLSRPDKRCPLLNERNECRLHKKYGPYVLCDTCYFHPRTFWQVDEQSFLSACLSCPECARLALMHEEPTAFAVFEAEIDPSAEWLETELIPDPEARELLRSRDELVHFLCAFLQERTLPLPERIKQALYFLEKLAPGADQTSPGETPAFDPETLMAEFTEVFDPVSDALEKPAQGTVLFMRELAGGTEGYIRLLAANFRKGLAVLDPFLRDRPWLEENFLVHCIFSDSFKQFTRYQNETLTAAEILRHEAGLLTAWYWYFRVLMSGTALKHGKMTEELFLQTAARSDKLWWHYPDWFGRCADRMGRFSHEDLSKIVDLLNIG